MPAGRRTCWVARWIMGCDPTVEFPVDRIRSAGKNRTEKRQPAIRLQAVWRLLRARRTRAFPGKVRVRGRQCLGRAAKDLEESLEGRGSRGPAQAACQHTV